jgi:superfamily II DNA or RNA helicase
MTANGDSHNDGAQPSGHLVRHPRHGVGTIEVDRGTTAIVRFLHGIEECPRGSLTNVIGLVERSHRSQWDSPLETIVRLQAATIRSVNDTWGVFSRSRIDLLPHQLWVCRKVLERWPARWLVADDVGLGKTIEAGLVLWPLLSAGRVRRLLILCPASLCQQWQTRLREMFDIRVALHDPAVDTAKSDFWNTNNQVIASLQTLRFDATSAGKERQERLLTSEPWDLMLVDEAHHLNYDEQAGPTLGYKLVDSLVARKRVRSMVFFTGTPHRGKHFGFLALLRLLRADLFDPAKPLSSQLPHLREVLIRNNKSEVTDLRGGKIFSNPTVSAESYRYTLPEQQFYDLLSEFIATGRAYANSLSAGDARTVQLVLIAMQKLASSSVAAIRRALEGRLARIKVKRSQLDHAQKKREALAAYREAEDAGMLDELASLDELIVELEADVALGQNEEASLEALLRAASAVREETKIRRILDIVAQKFDGEAVLFFTEYKATQALLMSALIAAYGKGTVTFINGDERAEGIIDTNGCPVSMSVRRQDACEMFNKGRARFLVSTEAAGEGVDLQENCSALIHVDLPWNPMRLHQRVGRLNRYGQRKRVRVVSVRNPDTVEARIWEKLDAKIKNIMEAQARFMEEPEDLLELVLGMTSPSTFRELFADASDVPRERLAEWFDQKTARFGGVDALATVQQLVGNAAKFDFQQVSTQMPLLDLPDLRPFFVSQLALNRRRMTSEGETIGFKTPEQWLDDPAVRTHYDSLVFNRHGVHHADAHRVIGVGHRAFDASLRQASEYEAAATCVSAESMKRPVVVVRIKDRVTDSGRHLTAVVLGVEIGESGAQDKPIVDWQLLQRLNELTESERPKAEACQAPAVPQNAIAIAVDRARIAAEHYASTLQLPFQVPEAEPIGILWPAGDR